MRLARLALMGAAAALMSGAAFAQDESANRLYGRLIAGVSLPDEVDQDLAYNPAILFLVTPPSLQTVDAGTGYAVGGALGFRYDNGFRTELEYRYQSSDLDEVRFNAPTAPTVAPDASLAAHFLMTNVIYEFRNSSRLTPYIGGGVGAAWVTSWTGPGDATGRDLTYAYQGRAGLAFALNETTRLGAEYVYVRTGELTYGPESFTPTGPGGPKIDGGEFAASTILVSLEKSF